MVTLPSIHTSESHDRKVCDFINGLLDRPSQPTPTRRNNSNICIQTSEVFITPISEYYQTNLPVKAENNTPLQSVTDPMDMGTPTHIPVVRKKDELDDSQLLPRSKKQKKGWNGKKHAEEAAAEVAIESPKLRTKNSKAKKTAIKFSKSSITQQSTSSIPVILLKVAQEISDIVKLTDLNQDMNRNAAQNFPGSIPIFDMLKLIPDHLNELYRSLDPEGAAVEDNSHTGKMKMTVFHTVCQSHMQSGECKTLFKYATDRDSSKPSVSVIYDQEESDSTLQYETGICELLQQIHNVIDATLACSLLIYGEAATPLNALNSKSKVQRVFGTDESIKLCINILKCQIEATLLPYLELVIDLGKGLYLIVDEFQTSTSLKVQIDILKGQNVTMLMNDLVGKLEDILATFCKFLRIQTLTDDALIPLMFTAMSLFFIPTSASFKDLGFKRIVDEGLNLLAVVRISIISRFSRTINGIASLYCLKFRRILLTISRHINYIGNFVSIVVCTRERLYICS